MSARDELALDIFLADNSSIPEGELRQDWVDAPDYHRPYAQNIADGLTAKGYRKPRIIMTVEELDALKDPATIVTDHLGHAHQWGIGMDDSEGWMAPHDQSPITSRHLWRLKPITVLQEPEAEASR